MRRQKLLLLRSGRSLRPYTLRLSSMLARYWAPPPAASSPEERGAPPSWSGWPATGAVFRPFDGSTPRPSSRPLIPPIFSNSSSDLGSTSMARVEGFSRNGVGSVVSFDGSRWAISGGSFFFALSFLSFFSTLVSLVTVGESSRDDHVPTLQFFLCVGVEGPEWSPCSPMGARRSFSPAMRAMLPPISELGVGNSSEKWTLEVLVNVGDGGVRTDDALGDGEWPGVQGPPVACDGERWPGSLTSDCWRLCVEGVAGDAVAGARGGPSRSVVMMRGGEGGIATDVLRSS